MGESSNSDWMNQWQALSRQYMNAWQELSHNATTAAPPAAPAWHEGFEQWARSFASAGSGQNGTVDRLVDSAKSYAAFVQAMLATMAQAPQDSAAPWSEALRQGFATPGALGGLFEHPAARVWRDLQEQGSAGMAQFMGMLGALRAPPPGDFSDLKGWLKTPAFGVMREHQEHYQRTGLAWLDYQEQQRRYNELMLAASRRGFELFEGKLSEREQPGRQIDSLRALYDLWVDAAEEGYAEIALSPSFREVSGALVNAQMRLRAQIQQEVERVAAEFGMPTRSEINGIGERLQALRREVRARGATVGEDLAEEVATLREEFAALKASVNAAAVSEPRADQPSRGPRAVRKPRAAGASRKTKREAPAERAVAATASGNFASRIEKFASESLGAPRKRAPREAKPAGKHKNKR